MRGTPFARFNTLMALVSAMLAQHPGMQFMTAYQQAGGYHSRGKGKGRNRMAKTNHLRGRSSKYMPHQGKQECARRAARMGG
jgi:hypothetical protein